MCVCVRARALIFKLTGHLPESLGDLTGLLVLSVGTNQLHGSIPASLGRLQALTDLDLRENQFR